MKKMILFAALALSSLIASAELRYKSISNTDGKTTVCIIDDFAPSKIAISDVVLHTCGKEYKAKSTKSRQEAGMADITMTFKRLIKFDDTYVTFKYNGREVKVPILRKETDRILSPL